MGESPTSTPKPTMALRQAFQADRVLTLRPNCKPSRDLDYTTVQAIAILITLGGEHTIHYVTESRGKDEIGHEKWINHKGDKISINPAYIVQRTEVALIHSTLNTTDHLNYRGKQQYREAIHHIVRAVPRGTKIEISTETIGSSHDRPGPGTQLNSWTEITT